MADWFDEYAEDPHFLMVIDGTESLQHPEGCPVSLAFDWEAEPTRSVVIYECPAAREAYNGSGLPDLPDGAYLVSVERDDAGRVGWAISLPGDMVG